MDQRGCAGPQGSLESEDAGVKNREGHEKDRRRGAAKGEDDWHGAGPSALIWGQSSSLDCSNALMLPYAPYPYATREPIFIMVNGREEFPGFPQRDECALAGPASLRDARAPRQ